MPSTDSAVAPRRSLVVAHPSTGSNATRSYQRHQHAGQCRGTHSGPRDVSQVANRREEAMAVNITDPGAGQPGVAIVNATRHEQEYTVSKSSDTTPVTPPLPPTPPLSSSLFSRHFLARSLPVRHRHKRQDEEHQRGRSRSRTLVNPLIGASDDTASTASSSSTYSTRSTVNGESSTRPDLPILRYKYVARNVHVLVGSRWRLQPFQERTVELRTGNAPCLLIYPITSDDEREIVGHDTQILPLDTTCQLTSSRTSNVMNGLKLSSNKEHRAFRVRIRFATAADAVIWCKIVQDALRHARWSRHLVPATSLSSSIPAASTCSGSGTYSTSSFTPVHPNKVLLFVHLATRRHFIVKSLGNCDIDCNEIRILKKLWGAPSASARDLVTGYRVMETANEVRVIMPNLPGETLLQFLQKRPKPCILTESEARQLVESLCRHLQAIHAAGVVHCDLKLENIVLTDVSNTRIIDFGGAFDLMAVTDLVKGDDNSEPRRGPASSYGSNDAVSMVGTPGYISPERILRPADPPSPRADVFSLGVVLFQLLAGQHPFTEAARTHRPLKLRDSLALDWTKAQTLLIMRGVSVEARQLLRRMLERDPSMRIPVEELLCCPWMTNSS